MWWRVSLKLILMSHLVDRQVHIYLISFLCNIPSVLAAVSETAFPQLLQLSESFSEMTVISIEHARVSSFFIDAAKSAETSCLVIIDVSIALVFEFQLVYHSLNDISIKTVYLYLGLGLDILVLHIHGVKIRLVDCIVA